MAPSLSNLLYLGLELSEMNGITWSPGLRVMQTGNYRNAIRKYSVVTILFNLKVFWSSSSIQSRPKKSDSQVTSFTLITASRIHITVAWYLDIWFNWAILTP